ncbi:MAG: glycosyltransferase family 4 protein [Limnothrix sp. RL_2_0]|nr:glycosyltransferase family 4 protein [Limnothrix sp. RL_2_0]
MKVALISSTFLPSHDGVSITLFERLKKLSEANHSVLCFVSSYAEIAQIYPNWRDYVGNIFPNVEVITLSSQEWMGVPQERNPLRKSLLVINEALEKFQPDIIEIEEPERLWTTLFVLPGLAYARNHQIPYIGCYRTNFIDYIPDYVPSLLVGIAKSAATLLTKWVYNQCSITLVGSQFIEQKLLSWGIKNVDYAKVIGPPVVTHPEKLKNPNFFAEFYDLPGVDQNVKILFLGRLSPDKNWDFSLKYLPRLREQTLTNKYTLIVAGRGELDELIANSEFVQELSTVILGEVPHERIPQLLTNVDLHVTASLKETFGRTVQESLYVGTPVLAPDCDWTRNLVESNFNGILYDSENGTDFIEKLTSLINNTGDRQKLGQNALSSQSAKNDPTYIWIDYLEKRVNLAKQSNL